MDSIIDKTLVAKKAKLDEMLQYQDNSIISRMIIKQEKGNITLFAFDKGQSLSEHTAPFDAFVQIIDGSGEIIINGELNLLSKGESIIMPANIPHSVVAPDRFQMLLTMIKS